MSILNVDEFKAKLTPEEQDFFDETVLNGNCSYCKKEKCFLPHIVTLPVQTIAEPPRHVIFNMCERCHNDPQIIKKMEQGFIDLHLATIAYVEEEAMN